ncbi:MAG: hypothetical protein V1824_04360, partial [archaeon]
LRETTYTILQSLIQKGLISSSIKNNTRYFSAADPEMLVEILEQKKEKISTILSQLNEIKKTEYRKPTVEFYEGKEGLKSVFKEIISINDKKIYGIINSPHLVELLPLFTQQIIKQRVKKDITSYMILDPSKESAKFKFEDKDNLRQTKTLNFISNLNIGIYIFEDKIAFLTFDQDIPVGLVISNSAISSGMLEIHKHLWKEAK